jgi:hypothetical protein
MAVGEQRKSVLPDTVGLLGTFLWAMTLFLRETPVIHDPNSHFWLSIAPNFSVALLSPMLLVNFYPILFKKNLTYRLFLYGLVLIFVALLMAEIVHTLFLGSGFDIFDLLASLAALTIMAWLYRIRTVWQSGDGKGEQLHEN